MRLRQILDKFYNEYNFKEHILHDPIEFPHQYKRSEDIEVSGFIASCFAYGRVDLFKPVIKKILFIMGKSPYEFLLNFNIDRHRHLFSDIRYRFNKNEDIICLLYVISAVIKKYCRIESLFKEYYKESDPDIGNGLSGFVNALVTMEFLAFKDNSSLPASFCRKTGKGFHQFFPSPQKGSACKRMNMFLRWMIRDRDIDFGLWKGIPKNKLIIPLDTHISRISKCLGFTKRASNDWKKAVEITEALKKIDTEDPLKYDFALCHNGISRVCNKMKCNNCVLK